MERGENTLTSGNEKILGEKKIDRHTSPESPVFVTSAQSPMGRRAVAACQGCCHSVKPRSRRGAPSIGVARRSGMARGSALGAGHPVQRQQARAAARVGLLTEQAAGCVWHNLTARVGDGVCRGLIFWAICGVCLYPSFPLGRSYRGKERGFAIGALSYVSWGWCNRN